MNTLLKKITLVVSSLLLLLTFAKPVLAAVIWDVRTVDSPGSMGSYTSLTLDGNGRPVISYYDEENADLKVVHCGDATCRSGNTIVTVDSVGLVGLHSSIRLDVIGRPVISYYDESNLDLKLVHCGDANCTSGNLFAVVDSNVTLPQDDNTSLRLDINGRPVISYFSAPTNTLRLLRCGDPNCSGGNSVQSIEGNGHQPSLVLDNVDNPVISYVQQASGTLKVAHCVTPTCSNGSVIQTVDATANVGFFSSLALDSAGIPVISYFDAGNSDLKLARCSDVNCDIDTFLQPVDQAGDVGQQTSLDLDGRDNPVITYQDVTNGNLKLVQCGDATCTSNNLLQVVDQLGVVGQFPSLLLDANDRAVISYFDASNRDLKLARLVDDGTGALPPLVLGSTTSGQISGVSFGDEDLLRFDPVSNRWSMFFDGSDVGLKSTDVDGLVIDGSTLLLSFELSVTVPSLGVVEPSDIVRFLPTSLGARTSGTFEWFLDGSDLGLETDGEDIDAFERLSDGRLIVSTRASFSLPALTGKDHDLLILNNPTFGAESAGIWSLYFDGDDVGLTTSSEDVRSIGINDRNEIFLTTNGAFAIADLVGDGSDIFICTPGSLGSNTSCSYRLFFEGDVNGFGSEAIDSFDFAPSLLLSSSDPNDTSVNDPNEDDHGNGDEEQAEQVFLPMMRR